MRSRTHGVTLIELMVVSTVTLTVSAGLFTLLYRSWMNHDVLLTQNLVQREARTALDMVCDELRTLSTWSSSNVLATNISTGAMVGQCNPSYSSELCFSISRVEEKGPDGKVTRQYLTKANYINSMPQAIVSQSIVNNISEFNIVYEARAKTTDGSIRWQPISDMNNDPIGATPPDAEEDLRILAITAAHVKITAAREAANGQTYSCTMTSTVRIRNQTYPIVAPVLPSGT